MKPKRFIPVPFGGCWRCVCIDKTNLRALVDCDNTIYIVDLTKATDNWKAILWDDALKRLLPPYKGKPPEAIIDDKINADDWLIILRNV